MIGRQTLALVERSLRVDTRLARTHLVRLGFAALILLLLAQVEFRIEQYSTPGRDVFLSICWLNFFLLNLAAMSLFSTVITEEKEEMTLGLLRMAGINPIGILLGKVTPRLIGAAMLLSVQLPFTFLAITLGGVTIHQILAAYISLLAFAVMVSGLGSLLSTVCQRSNIAASLTTAVLAILYIGPVLADKAVLALFRKGWISVAVRDSLDRGSLAVRSSTPLYSLDAIMETNFAGSLFSYQVVVNLITGAILFAAAWALFDMCTRNDNRVAPSRGLMALFSKRVSTASMQGRVWQNAVAWKDFNFLTGGYTAVGIKLIAYVVLMGGMSVLIAREIRTDYIDSVGATLMLSMLTALIVEIPIYLSRVFREELRWQTWPGLVLLPENVGRIARSKLIGISPTFVPAVVVFIIGAILAPGFLTDMLKEAFLQTEGWYAISQFVLGVHLVVALSLYAKWGALPFGIAAVIVPNVVFFLAFNFRPPDSALIFPIVAAVIIAISTQRLIVHRLTTLASL